jgi:hypothetical protein
MTTEDETDAVVGEIFVPEGASARDEQVICILLHPKAGLKKGDNKEINIKPIEDPPAESSNK